MKGSGMKRLSIAGLGLAAALTAGLAMARTGDQFHPIVVHFKRGSDSVTLTGTLRQNRDCCSYAFKAHAGQQLYWRVDGPATRQVIRYPDGHTDGPGLPNPLSFPADGAYVLRVSPNLMADGAFGKFVLELKIPPASR